MANTIAIALALKPFKDLMDAYDSRNSYRPDHPASVTIADEGDTKITLQHLINAQTIFNEMIGE